MNAFFSFAFDAMYSKFKGTNLIQMARDQIVGQLVLRFPYFTFSAGGSRGRGERWGEEGYGKLKSNIVVWYHGGSLVVIRGGC